MMSFKEYIAKDRDCYDFLQTWKSYLRVWILREHELTIWKYQKLLRKEEYFALRKNLILSTFYRYRKNKLGERLGFTIPKFTFSQGLHIWHYGNIVVNANVRVGEGCILHGDNCIGNDGSHDNGCPIIGNNVDIGVGAKIIGNIRIVDNVTIGAGAVVVKDVLEDGCVVAGIPAKIIKHKK